MTGADNDNALVPADAGRVTEIERVIADPVRHAEYDRSPALQDEYRGLLAKRSGVSTIATSGVSEAIWQAQLASARQAVEPLLSLVSDRDSFIASFDTLPANARSVVYEQLGHGSPGYAEPASAMDLQRFSNTSEGAEMVQAWGPYAPQRLGILRERMGRILGRCRSDGEALALSRWFDDLDALSAKAVMGALAR